jgi:hypothetical protein
MTQQKKKAATDKKPGARSKDKAWEAKEFKGKAKADPSVNYSVEHRAHLHTTPYFDCTRHNVRRQWSKQRDVGASVQVVECFRHGVAIPWKRGGPPLPYNHGVSCRGLP